jgi:hypothetical protein
MSRPFVVDSPEITHIRQAEHVFVGGNAALQNLGNYTSKTIKMFWATAAEINTQITAIHGSGWALDGEPSVTPIYLTLDIYNAELSMHKHTPI